MKPKSLCINNDVHYFSDEFVKIETFSFSIVATISEMFFSRESGIHEPYDIKRLTLRNCVLQANPME